jgi:type I restriction enzyme M protein
MNVARGANIRNLTQGILSKIEVHKPGINIQLEMVSKLEKERELIFSTNSLIDLYEQKIKDRIAKVWGGPSVKNLPGGQI